MGFVMHAAEKKLLEEEIGFNDGTVEEEPELSEELLDEVLE